MLPAKVRHYEEKYKQHFPLFQSLREDVASATEHALLSRFGFVVPPTPETWVDLERSLQPLAGINARDRGFTLEMVFVTLGITPAANLYLWWSDTPHHIDKMALSDVLRIFNEIWWPSTDDIDLFDDSREWIVRIDHGGFVSAIKAPK